MTYLSAGTEGGREVTCYAESADGLAWQDVPRPLEMSEGAVRWISQVGDQVQAGDVLGWIDDASARQSLVDAELSVLQAQEALEEAQDTAALEQAVAHVDVEGVGLAVDVGDHQVEVAGEDPIEGATRDDLVAGLIRAGHRHARAITDQDDLTRLVREQGRAQGFQEREVLDADALVIAEGMTAIRPDRRLFADRGIAVHLIGDAREPRNLMLAIAEGEELGRSI